MCNVLVPIIISSHKLKFQLMLINYIMFILCLGWKFASLLVLVIFGEEKAHVVPNLHYQGSEFDTHR